MEINGEHEGKEGKQLHELNNRGRGMWGRVMEKNDHGGKGGREREGRTSQFVGGEGRTGEVERYL